MLSTFLYAAETWTIKKEVENPINAFEMWLFRKMLRISYQDHITNEEVLRRVKEKRTLLQTNTQRYKRDDQGDNGPQTSYSG